MFCNKINRVRIFAALILLCFITACSASKNAPTNTPMLIIKQVELVDVLSGVVIPKQDVVVNNGVIVFVGAEYKGPVSAKTQKVDGKGKYLIPGLWDMHIHLCWQAGNDRLIFPILLKHGITGIRDMGGDLAIMRSFKTSLEKGEYLGPEIIGSGPMIDGNPPVHPDFTLPVDDESNMEALLDSLKGHGADYFKTYSLIKENQLRQVAAFSAANQIPFAGHLSEYIPPEINIELGQKSVEHLNVLDGIWETNKRRLDSIGRMMVKQRTFLCPTLITYALKTKLRDSSITKLDYESYIPASLKKEWQTTWAKRLERHSRHSDWEKLEHVFSSQKSLVSHLHKMGVMILAGTDFAGMPYVYPGIGLVEELMLLSEAGLSNAEVLKTATINPAIYYERQVSSGSISVGKFADMVLLQKNPLDQLEHLKNIETVFLKGKQVR